MLSTMLHRGNRAARKVPMAGSGRRKHLRRSQTCALILRKCPICLSQRLKVTTAAESLGQYHQGLHMAPNRLTPQWLQLVLAALALGALAILGGCGGGSGAPNNPFAPGPVSP